MNKPEIIFSLTNEMHDDVTNIYESAVDNENEEAIKQIDALRSRLNSFKTNLINQSNEV